MKKDSRNKQSKSKLRPVVPGISMSHKNEATVDPELTEHLLDLAETLEERTRFPVDVEHVLAAIVMGANTSEISADCKVDKSNESLIKTLEKYVRVVFSDFNGKVGQDD